jgi:two-component system NtrC family sensor kinase
MRLPDAPGIPESTAPGETSSDAQPIARAILVVDDEPDIGEVIAEIVAPFAARVDVVESGRAAIERLAGDRYDLVISDLRMPELDGPALYDHLKSSGVAATCPILFVTGDTLHHRLEEFLTSAGTRVVEKPFEPQLLRDELMAVLARAN